MSGKTDLKDLLRNMNPTLNEGTYVFCVLDENVSINPSDTLCEFKEKEGLTVVLEQEKADMLRLPYDFVASWITLRVHSSLQAVGLTAAFSTELAEHGISCNVIAGFYHDHIFVEKEKAEKALTVLADLASKY